MNTDGSYQFRDVGGVIADQLQFEPLVSTSIDYEITDTTGATDTATITVNIEGGGVIID